MDKDGSSSADELENLNVEFGRLRLKSKSASANDLRESEVGKSREEIWSEQQERGFTAWLNLVLSAGFDLKLDGSHGEEPKVLSAGMCMLPFHCAMRDLPP